MGGPRARSTALEFLLIVLGRFRGDFPVKSPANARPLLQQFSRCIHIRAPAHFHFVPVTTTPLFRLFANPCHRTSICSLNRKKRTGTKVDAIREEGNKGRREESGLVVKKLIGARSKAYTDGEKGAIY